MSLKQQIQDIFTEELKDSKSVQSHPFGTIETIRLRILNEALDEATRQIREIDNDIDAEIQKFGYEGVYPSLIPCEADLVGQKRALKKVLAVLVGSEKK